MKNKKIVYFLCTGNSCCSQMAEEWAKKYLGDAVVHAMKLALASKNLLKQANRNEAEEIILLG
jgi:protein-tyrosine-phosphatase